MQNIAVTAVNNRGSARIAHHPPSCYDNSNSDNNDKEPKATITTEEEEVITTTKLLKFSTIPFRTSSIPHPKYHDYSTITVEDIEERTINMKSSKEEKSSSSQSKSIIAINMPRFTNKTTFPSTLHVMLSFIDHHPDPYDFEGYDGMIRPCDIMKWEYHGRSFIIYDKILLTNCLLPMFFPYQTEYSSFQKQLNLYGFLRIVTNTKEMTSTVTNNYTPNSADYENNKPDSSRNNFKITISSTCYYHEMFLRTRYDLCYYIIRLYSTTTKKTPLKNSKMLRQNLDTKSEPKFDLYEPLLLHLSNTINNSSNHGVNSSNDDNIIPMADHMVLAMPKNQQGIENVITPLSLGFISIPTSHSSNMWYEYQNEMPESTTSSTVAIRNLHQHVTLHDAQEHAQQHIPVPSSSCHTIIGQMSLVSKQSYGNNVNYSNHKVQETKIQQHPIQIQHSQQYSNHSKQQPQNCSQQQQQEHSRQHSQQEYQQHHSQQGYQYLPHQYQNEQLQQQDNDKFEMLVNQLLDDQFHIPAMEKTDLIQRDQHKRICKQLNVNFKVNSSLLPSDGLQTQSSMLICEQQPIQQVEKENFLSEEYNSTLRVDQKKRKMIEMNHNNKMFIPKIESPCIIDSDFSSFVTCFATTTTVPDDINDRIGSFVTNSSNREFMASELEPNQVDINMSRSVHDTNSCYHNHQKMRQRLSQYPQQQSVLNQQQSQQNDYCRRHGDSTIIYPIINSMILMNSTSHNTFNNDMNEIAPVYGFPVNESSKQQVAITDKKDE